MGVDSTVFDTTSRGITSDHPWLNKSDEQYTWYWIAHGLTVTMRWLEAEGSRRYELSIAGKNLTSVKFKNVVRIGNSIFGRKIVKAFDDKFDDALTCQFDIEGKPPSDVPKAQFMAAVLYAAEITKKIPPKIRSK